LHKIRWLHLQASFKQTILKVKLYHFYIYYQIPRDLKEIGTKPFV